MEINKIMNILLWKKKLMVLGFCLLFKQKQKKMRFFWFKDKIEIFEFVEFKRGHVSTLKMIDLFVTRLKETILIC